MLKTPKKYQEFFLTLFVKTGNFQLVFNFDKMSTVTIWRAFYNASYTMMTKPIRAKELHYPMIQFLIISIIAFFGEGGWVWGWGGDHTGTCRVTCQVWMKDVDVYSDAFQVFVLSEVEKLWNWVSFLIYSRIMWL